MQEKSSRDEAQAPWGLHWFRRDLRVCGNEALRFNWKSHQGRVLGIFCFDSKFLAREDFSPNRFQFFLKTLKALREEWRAQGGDLLVVDGLPAEVFPRLLRFFDEQKISRPSLVTWNRDYEPFARRRDEEVSKIWAQEGIATSTHRDHLIFEPYEVLKSEKGNDFYQIYSPFARKWFAKLAEPEGQARIHAHKNSHRYYKNLEKGEGLEKTFHLQWKDFLKSRAFPYADALEDFAKKNKPHVTIDIPEAGSLVAYKKLLEFKKNLEDYQTNRDFPALHGTSKLSIYLKNGSLTTSQIVSTLQLENLKWDSKSGALQYLKEIVWREFYYSILFHRPDVEKTSFLPQYAKLRRENSEKLFKAWQEGRTGYPIVDAGMRELLTTGWMHNRVRMIVASFLTKDLLIDWRWGENHFMKLLLDGDLAPNNGGWQWAASTGCDPQPYFRVFNPWLQSEKFDPDGEYIKTFVPELRAVEAKHLHDPEELEGRYIKPIVDHKAQKEKAIALFKNSK